MSNQKQSAVRALLLPTLCLFVVCLVTSGLLALTNSMTEPKIQENLRLEAERLYRVVLPDAETFESTEVQMEGKTYTVQIGMQSGQPTGYVFETQMAGYGGPVVCLTGINAEGVVTGVQILSMTETAGLGMNAAKPEFIDQYKGKKQPLQVVKGEVKAESDIQAISGATITSNAVTQSVNQAMQLFQSLPNRPQARALFEKGDLAS